MFTYYITYKLQINIYFRATSSKKPTETPVIVVSEHGNVDLIGPPDQLSNLRPVIRRILDNESPLQHTLRELQNDTQKKNQEFWSLHNQNFAQVIIKRWSAYLSCNVSGHLSQSQTSLFVCVM